MELGRAGRAYSGPLPERPHSSASNMSANSDPSGPSPGRLLLQTIPFHLSSGQTLARVQRQGPSTGGMVSQSACVCVGAGGEAWVRSQAGAAHMQSALVNGGGRDVRRSDSGRAGPSGIDPGGHQRRDIGGAGPHPQVCSAVCLGGHCVAYFFRV